MTGITTDEETCQECGGELAFYQFVMNDDDVVFTLGSERQDATELANKAQTQTGAKMGMGMSSSGPKASGEGFLQDVDEIENKDVVSSGRSVSITYNPGVSIQTQILNPDNIDFGDGENHSGCLDPNCPNNMMNDIERVKSISNTTSKQKESNSVASSDESSEGLDDRHLDDSIDDFFGYLEDENISTEGIDPRDELRDQSDISPVHKIKSGLSSAVGWASAGAATIRGGLNTTVEKAQGRFMDEETTLSVSPDDGTELGVTHRDDGTTVTLADDSTERADTTVAVGASGEFQPAYNDDGTFTVDIAEETDATIAVSPGTDDADWSVTDDGVEMGLADGAVTVDQGTDDFQMETDEDGTITLTMGDGHTPERSSTKADRTNPDTSNETAEATETTTTTASESTQSASKDTPNHANGADSTDSSQTQNSDTTTPFLGYDDGREQTHHRNGHDSTGTTNSEETSNDNEKENDDDETNDPGGTSL